MVNLPEGLSSFTLHTSWNLLRDESFIMVVVEERFPLNTRRPPRIISTLLLSLGSNAVDSKLGLDKQAEMWDESFSSRWTKAQSR